MAATVEAAVHRTKLAGYMPNVEAEPCHHLPSLTTTRRCLHLNCVVKSDSDADRKSERMKTTSELNGGAACTKKVAAVHREQQSPIIELCHLLEKANRYSRGIPANPATLSKLMAKLTTVGAQAEALLEYRRTNPGWRNEHDLC